MKVNDELESLTDTLEDSVDVATWWAIGTTKTLLYSLPAALFVGITIGLCILAVKKPIQILGGIE